VDVLRKNNLFYAWGNLTLYIAALQRIGRTNRNDLREERCAT
jgi:hypothetical protein